MKRLFFLLLLLPCFSFGQNLVPNPSFEDTTECPTTQGQITYAVGWESYGLSPELFHSCSPLWSNVSIPFNWGGYQPTASGNSYSGLGTYIPDLIDTREILGAQLDTPLNVGIKYFVSFQACLSYSDQIQAYIAANKLGAKFSTVPYSWNNPPPINNTSHVYTDSIITDSINWTRIFGSFIPDSSYEYIMIGNFFDSININTVVYYDSAFSGAYYYIDDVCVSTDSAYCAAFSYTGVTEPKQENSFTIHPNPTTGVARITNGEQGITNIEVFDLFGRSVPFEFDIGSSLLDIQNSPPGIYLVKVGDVVKKLVLH